MTDAVTGGPEYLRKFSLVVADQYGNGVDFAQFRVTFNVRRGDSQTPNSADVRIFNLSENTANQICQPEFSQLQLQAGYQNAQYGLIFQGTIKQTRKGRVDQKDNYVDITAADGDSAYNFSTMALTLAANSLPENGLLSMIASMAAHAVSPPDAIPGISKVAFIRGRVFYGMTRDELREFCESYGLTWSIQNGALQLVPLTGYIPGDTPIIGPATGLIGIPEQTASGITFRCLLNPNIKVGGLVKLDSKNINLYRYGLDSTSVGNQVQLSGTGFGLTDQIGIAADGLYYVMNMSHMGDSRGQPWYTDVLCLKTNAELIGAPLPQGSTVPENVVPRYP